MTFNFAEMIERYQHRAKPSHKPSHKPSQGGADTSKPDTNQVKPDIALPGDVSTTPNTQPNTNQIKPDKVASTTQPDNNQIKPDYTYITDNESLLESIEQYKTSEVIGVDIETTGKNALDPYTSKIRLVQLAALSLPTLVIDCFNCDVKLITPVLENEAVKVAHNACFELKFFESAGIEVKGNIFDTMLAHKLLYLGRLYTAEGKSSLENLALVYLGVTLDKEPQRSDWGADTLTQDQLDYAARDASILLDLRAKLIPEFKAKKLGAIAKREFECVRVTASMELNGVLIDTKKWLEIEASAKQKMNEAESKAKELLGKPDINLNSNPQVLKALKGLGLNITDTKKTTLLKLIDDYKDLVEAILDYRYYSKRVSTYGSKFIEGVNPVTGRVHSSFDQCINTGRFSSSSPNIQNIPRLGGYRSCFISAPGHKIIQCDYGQIELRVAAEIYGETRLIQAFRDNEDIHKLTASAIYKKPIDQITKSERSLAKTVNFGMLYGSGVETFQETCLEAKIYLSEAEVKNIFNAFFNLYTGFGRQKKLSQQIGGKKKPLDLRSKSGRLYRLGESGKYFGTDYLNYPIQGLCADITKQALINLYEALKPYGGAAKIIAMVHDEILVEAPEAIANEVKDVLAKSMYDAAAEYLKEVPVVADAVIIDNWGEK